MTDYKALYEQSQEENSMLRDLLQNRMPTGCIAETTYQPILKENEKLKEKLDSICIELYACWNCSCDLLTEDIGDICGYDEDKHKKLYEKKYKKYPRGGNIGGEH